MSAENAPRQADRRIADLAIAQHGVVSRPQLKRIGVSDRQLAHRIREGRLHRLYRGVYQIGHPAPTREGRLLAAVLACGDGATTSHHTAGDAWGLRPSAGRRIHVTAPGRVQRGTVGLVIHRSTLPAEEVTLRNAIPVTTVARTLLDLAGVLSSQQIERAVDRAEMLRLFDLRAVEAVLAAHPRRAGSALLAAVIDEHRAVVTTRSELEDRFLGLCAATGIEAPAVNVPVDGYEVDFLWRRERLIVETDGHAAHGTRTAFERDRARDARLTAAGYRVLRFTHRHVTREPGYVAEVLRSVLGAADQSGR